MHGLPKQSDLVEAMLAYMKSVGGNAHFKEIESGVIKSLQISASEASKVRSGSRTELAYRLSWARTKCKEQGLIQNIGNGVWQIVSK
jgi:restriction endonuclease Mrr